MVLKLMLALREIQLGDVLFALRDSSHEDESFVLERVVIQVSIVCFPSGGSVPQPVEC